MMRASCCNKGSRVLVIHPEPIATGDGHSEQQASSETHLEPSEGHESNDMVELESHTLVVNKKESIDMKLPEVSGCDKTSNAPGKNKKDFFNTQFPEVSGREKLKRHRGEVAGQVWIPDIWGQEELLKDWIDCAAFSSSLVPNGLMSARASLAEEGRRSNSGGMRIVNRC